MQQITGHLWTFSGLRLGRVYLIEEGDALALVDTGLPGTARQAAAQLRAHGRDLRALTHILITHEHPDHIGGLAEIRAQCSAQVISAEAARPVIQGEQELRPPRLLRGIMPSRFDPVPVDRIVGEGDVIDGLLGGLQVIATPGHARGHLCYWAPEPGVLFLGDVLFHFAGITEPLRALTPDPAENRRSIQRIAALDAQIACFGHGPVLTRGAARRIRRFAAHFETGSA